MSNASFDFVDVYSKVLLPFLEGYKQAKNEKTRAHFVKDAREAVLKSNAVEEDRAMNLPKDLKTAISRYFKGSVQKEKSEEASNVKPSKLKPVYSIRDVIKKLHPELIRAQIPYQSTDKEYIGSYQQAVTKVMANLSEEDLEEAERITEEWNEKGASADVQLKMAKKKLPKEIKKKLEEWKFASGALMMCLVAYPDGNTVKSFHIESSPEAGNCFTNSCTDWKDGTYENFKEWAAKQFGEKEQDSDDEEDVPVQFIKAKDLTFDRNDDDEFIVPSIRNLKTMKQKQRVVRGYIGAVYREFTGNSGAAFPYSLAAKDDQIIYSPDCVSEGFRLSDPDHLTGHKISSLYNHWLARQKKGLSPFIVLKGNPHHGESGRKARRANKKGKNKMPWVHVDDDDMEVGEEEEDPVPSDGDEDMLLDVKIGPPMGKKRTIPDPTEDPSQVAGPSTLSPLPDSILPLPSTLPVPSTAPVSHTFPAAKPLPKPLPQKRKSKKVQSDAGETKDERQRKGKSKIVPEDSPVRSTRKRKAEEEMSDDSAGSRKKMKLPSPLPVERPILPVSPPHPPVRSRDAGRVKDFPAGNIATSSSRIAFLKSLCNLPKYLDLVHLVQVVPKPSPIPSNYPAWASWKSRETNLPAEFHTSKAFTQNISMLKKDLADSSFLPAKIDAPLLLLGLMYQEVSRAIEVEPDTPTKAPDHLVHSPFGVKELKRIESLLKTVHIPSD